MKKIKLGIFSSSRNIPDDTYLKQIKQIGQTLDPMSVSIRYGGGDAGAMGVIPRTMAARGADVKGIDFKRFNDRFGSPDFGTTVVHDRFSDRQHAIVTESDVVLCLPGGIGTLSELCDVLVNNDLCLSERPKPIILFNWDHLFDPVIQYIRRGIEIRYITSWEKLNIHVVTNTEEFKREFHRIING